MTGVEGNAGRGPAGEPGWRARVAMAFLMAILPLAASLSAFLASQGHATLRSDTLAALAILGAICLPVALLHAVSHPLLRRFVEAALVVLLVDLNTRGMLWPLLAG